jgi:signal transduction histidine kinase
MLAHELRNPLGAVSSAVHLLEECGERDETATRAAAVARRQMRRLSRLVDDLLDVSRITRGQVPLHLAAVDLVEVLRLSVEDARAQFEQAGVELAVTLPVGGLPLEADATRLEQVFGNLLGNAAKYGQPGGSASLAVRRDGGVAVVRIADDGAGIESDALPRVFDLFFQGAPSLDRHDGGLGIGLTLVRKLVELHGGEVTAASDGTGHGSEFTVRLPLAG